jgi:hypothetical protein
VRFTATNIVPARQAAVAQLSSVMAAAAAAGAGAGAVGKWAGIMNAVFHYPLAVADRVISAARVCVAIRAVEVAGEVLTEVFYTLRHTADAAANVADTAGDTLKWTLGMETAARMTAFLVAGAKTMPFLLF